MPICLDSEGAQVRNQDMESESVEFKEGSTVKIHHRCIIGDSGNISLTPNNVYGQLIEGDVIHVDFHSVALKISKVGEDVHIAEVISPGKVGSNKAINIDRDIELSPVTEKDIEAFEIGKSMGVENYSLRASWSWQRHSIRGNL